MQVEHVLSLIPQQKPFRFVDELIEISDTHAVGRYQYKNDESFYEGHFPGNPVTPGVILIETMAQVGVVALGIYVVSKILPEHEVPLWTTFFTDCNVEFFRPVYPGAEVVIKAEKVFFKKMKIKSKVKMFLKTGELVCEGELSGIGVKNNENRK